MEQKGTPVPVRAQGTEKVPKKLWILSGFDSFFAPFRHFLEDVFLMFFGARLIRVFFALGAQIGPRGSQNGGKMEPKRCPGAPCGMCQNHSIYCAGGLQGGLGKTPGADFLQAASPDPARRGLGEDFCRFWPIWGSLGGPFGHENVHFFWAWKRVKKRSGFGRGRRKGFGSPGSSESADHGTSSVTPCTLKGGGEFKGFAPCRRPLINR